MSTEIKIKEDPDRYNFECTSELILENDLIKLEKDRHGDESVASPKMKAELKSIQSGKPVIVGEQITFMNKHMKTMDK